MKKESCNFWYAAAPKALVICNLDIQCTNKAKRLTVTAIDTYIPIPGAM